MGGRGHGPLASALLGSATLHVLNQATCPVMVVPASTSPGSYRRIILGVDGDGSTSCSRSALLWSLDAARRHGCPLIVAHALDLNAQHLLDSAKPASADLTESQLPTVDWLDVLLADVSQEAGGVSVTVNVLRGSAAGALLHEAGPDDLLVLGSRGRGGFTELILGSVATQCAQHAAGTVVIVKADHQRLES